ncbi:hypothetical protein [Mucilaginibacter antarcticus]|uniref:Lipoprotein n=1 Tax=Mucilaginibacter antarcticus TaxID=1855725 RepID=A0ABW5XIX7_9SPHI
MKILLFLFIMAATATMISSCSKQSLPVKTLARTVNFNRYTEKDFSAEKGNITFFVQITDGSKKLLDSAVATMRINEIPTQANKLIYAKTLNNTNGELKVGFKYVLENFGYSLHYDIFNSNEVHKEMNFSYK